MQHENELKLLLGIYTLISVSLLTYEVQSDATFPTQCYP